MTTRLICHRISPQMIVMRHKYSSYDIWYSSVWQVQARFLAIIIFFFPSFFLPWQCFAYQTVTGHQQRGITVSIYALFSSFAFRLGLVREAFDYHLIVSWGFCRLPSDPEQPGVGRSDVRVCGGERTGGGLLLPGHDVCQR